MRFKLDENIGNSFAAALEAAGHDVSTVVRQHMAGADDRRVYEVCVSEQRALVTFDLDFANPLDYEPTQTAGIVVFRLPNDATPSDISAAITTFLDAAEQHDCRGQLWVVARDRVRKHVPRASDEY